VCWGYNGYGGLGNASTTDSLTPVPVSNLTTVQSIGVSQESSCATLANGTATCWGYGALGQLGNQANANSSIPVAVNAVP
jgi:alpha-tubulin suppressor-like RCC1 family protein